MPRRQAFSKIGGQTMIDIYREFAALLFDVNVEKVNNMQRQFAKRWFLIFRETIEIINERGLKNEPIQT